MIQEETIAEKLFWECYPHELNNGHFMKGCWAKLYATKIVDAILKETLEEYTNDENHVRVEYWKQIRKEIEDITL